MKRSAQMARAGVPKAGTDTKRFKGFRKVRVWLPGMGGTGWGTASARTPATDEYGRRK